MKLRLMAAILLLITLTLISGASLGAAEKNSDSYANQDIDRQESGVDLGQQTWKLYSRKVDGGFLLAQTSSTGNNGPHTEIRIAGGESALWVSSWAGANDIEYSKGVWHIDLMTTGDWGTSGSLCQVDLGIWNGSAFEKFDIITLTSNYFQNFPVYDIRQVKSQRSPGIIRSNQKLALQITNRDSVPRTVFTAENTIGSYISGIIGGTITQLPANESPLRDSVSPSVPPSSAAQLTKAASITSPSASKDVIASKTAGSPTSQSSSADEAKSSLMGGILGIGIAIVIVIGLSLSVITFSRFMAKRKSRSPK